MEEIKNEEVITQIENTESTNTEKNDSLDPYKELKEEISHVRSQLERIDSRAGLLGELRSLVALVPNADIRSLDDEAIKAVEGGENLLYAYLLCEKRRSLIEQQLIKNAASSAGGVGYSAEDELFSIEEIKSMDRKTVRRNFDKIMRSLEQIK